MQKILIAIDSTPLNMHTVDFACYLAELTRSKLTGVFLEHLPGEPVPALKSVYGSTYVETITVAAIPENKTRIEQGVENMRLFEETCKKRNIRCYIQKITEDPLEGLIKESRFADVLVADAKLTQSIQPQGVLTDFLKEFLAKSECPVIVAPLHFGDIDEIIFAYDGSPSAVFALKQFTYLFPELSNKRFMIVQVNSREELPVIEKEKIGELLQVHYSAIGFHYLLGKASDELFGYLLHKQKAFVVMGSYGRHLISGHHLSSTADMLIKSINLPLFIAHR